jgi:D-threo-aldose 1-dehydrogenase
MMPTVKRRVGRTAVEVTQLGFGSGPLRVPSAELPDADAPGALEAAWAGGVRYFDTAPFYGRGLSEHLLGGFLPARCGEGFVLSTKVGRLIRPVPAARRPAARTSIGDLDTWQVRYDYSRDGVLRSLEDSIQRLGVSAIDLVLVHDLDLGFHFPQARMDAHTDELMRTGWPALQELKAERVIGGVGFGINLTGLVSHWLDRFDPDLFLVAGPYTLMNQSALAELDRCAERGVGVIIGQVWGSGILATGPVPGARYYYADATADELDKARRMQQACESFGVPLAAAAVQFPLAHPVVAAVIPGSKNAAEVRACLDAFSRDIPDELWAALKDQQLIAADAPTPKSGNP